VGTEIAVPLNSEDAEAQEYDHAILISSDGQGEATEDGVRVLRMRDIYNFDAGEYHVDEAKLMRDVKKIQRLVEGVETSKRKLVDYVQGGQLLLSKQDLIDFLAKYETKYLSYEIPFLINTIRRVRSHYGYDTTEHLRFLRRLLDLYHREIRKL